MIYLDMAATTGLRREVLAAMGPYLGPEFGNPSSQHGVGEVARRALDRARSEVASVLGARPSEVVFTSGGTEADNAAVKGLALASPRGRHVVISAVEHAAVRESAAFLARQGYRVSVLGVDGDGRVSPDDLAAALGPETALVSIQLANNEVGTVQPIAELAAVSAEHGVPFHTDAVQAAGWLDLDVGRLGVQALSLSGHKVGGPKGIGVLWVRHRTPWEPLIHGGGQQDGRRSGTEDVASCVGMATALAGAAGRATTTAPAVAARRDVFIDRVLSTVPGARLTGHPRQRLPGSASFVFPGRSGESILVELETRGVICSSGSACAAGHDEPSAVLIAMGLDEDVARTAVRFTFDSSVSDDDLDRVAMLLGEVTGSAAPAR